jgi:hypothetical protein
MHSQVIPAPAGRWEPLIDDTGLAGNPAWRSIEALAPRPLQAATYSQLVAGLAAGEVLIARVVVIVHGRIALREKAIACWVATGATYTALLHGRKAANWAVTGYYAVSNERLLSLLFG